MKILVVGGGGREHAIIMKLAESKKVSKLYCAPGNGGISKYAECFSVKATDIDGMLALAKKLEVDLVFVAPDDPLVAGMVDVMQNAGFRTFGPNKAAAIIEGSKVFSKNLMQKYNIPTAKYAVFNQPEKVLDYISNENTYPTVIKADGLALGKGVIIAQNYDEAKAAVAEIMEDKIFGESGSQVVVEEFLTGPEVSVLCFTDGKSIKPMISSMDHKRALDGDQGLNTGGMGTVAPNPYYTDEIANKLIALYNDITPVVSESNNRFAICIKHDYFITKNKDAATTTVGIDNDSQTKVKIVKEMKDPNNTHKYSCKACCNEINKRLNRLKISLTFNYYHFDLFCKYYNIKNNPELCYTTTTFTNPQHGYSIATIELIVDEIKKEISLIEETFQSFSFASTVEEYIAFFLRYYKLNISDPRKKIISALKMVGLKEDDLEKELATLSTSEQKLLQIASSLLSNPTVLLLDEPFINLDLKAQKKLERLLIKLKERYKKTIIIASHDSNLLYSLTDKLLLLKNGTILKQGKTKEIYQNVKYLLRYHYEIPDIVLFTYKAKEIKSAKIDYHKDIRDLIKDIYKHV